TAPGFVQPSLLLRHNARLTLEHLTASSPQQTDLLHTRPGRKRTINSVSPIDRTPVLIIGEQRHIWPILFPLHLRGKDVDRRFTDPVSWREHITPASRASCRLHRANYALHWLHSIQEEYLK
ncbi:unnamed protein product, partial [Pleuronectes platessa]